MKLDWFSLSFAPLPFWLCKAQRPRQYLLCLTPPFSLSTTLLFVFWCCLNSFHQVTKRNYQRKGGIYKCWGRCFHDASESRLNIFQQGGLRSASHLALFTLQATHSDKADTIPLIFNGELAISGRHERQWAIVTLASGWGVTSDATKFKILQLFEIEEWLSGAKPIGKKTVELMWLFFSQP